MNASLAEAAQRPAALPLAPFVLGLVLLLGALAFPFYGGLFLCLGLLSLGLIVTHRVAGSLVHPLSLTYLMFLVYFGVGLLILGCDDGQFDDALYFSAALACFSAGAWLASRRVFPKWKQAKKTPGTDASRESAAPTDAALYLLWGIGLAAYIYLTNHIGLPVFSSDPDIRYDVRGFETDIFQGAWILSGVGLFIKALQQKNTKLLAVALGLASVSLVLYSLLLYRYPALELVLALAIAYFALRKRGVSRLFLALAAGLLIVFGVQYWRSALFSAPNAFDSVFVWNFTISRVFMIGAQTLSFLFNNFPHPFPYFDGMTYVRVIRNLYHPESQLPSLGYFIYSSMMQGANPGYDPVSVPGELYVNFGLLGLLGGMSVLGGIGQWFFERMAARPTVYRMLAFSVGGMFLVRSFAYSAPGEVANLLVMGGGLALLRLLTPRAA
jgi:oligosaccharide repeat unit polymerase